MGALEDVCWHEAGHALVASLNGLLTLRVLVRPTTSGGDWIGYRHGAGGAPSARLNVAAAGMAGELVAKAGTWTNVTQPDLNSARNRSGDDRRQYDAIAKGKGVSFEDKVAEYCWRAITQNRTQHQAIADELIDRKRIGPLVLAEVLTGLTISDGARIADDLFLARLEAHKPAPLVP